MITGIGLEDFKKLKPGSLIRLDISDDDNDYCYLRIHDINGNYGVNIFDGKSVQRISFKLNDSDNEELSFKVLKEVK